MNTDGEVSPLTETQGKRLRYRSMIIPSFRSVYCFMLGLPVKRRRALLASNANMRQSLLRPFSKEKFFRGSHMIIFVKRGFSICIELSGSGPFLKNHAHTAA